MQMQRLARKPCWTVRMFPCPHLTAQFASRLPSPKRVKARAFVGVFYFSGAFTFDSYAVYIGGLSLFSFYLDLAHKSAPTACDVAYAHQTNTKTTNNTMPSFPASIEIKKSPIDCKHPPCTSPALSANAVFILPHCPPEIAGSVSAAGRRPHYHQLSRRVTAEGLGGAPSVAPL